jgi:hypothetical protein
VVIKNLQGGEQKIAAPKPVDASSRQLAQRANDKGLQLYKEKQYAQAEAAFTEALKYRPDFGLAANNLGFVYYKQEKYAEAARWFENGPGRRRSGAAGAFDDEDARGAAGVGGMGVALVGVEDVAGLQARHPFFAVGAVVHVDRAVHHRKHFRAVVDVPGVGLVGPVQAHGGVRHRGDQVGAPGTLRRVVAAAHDSHASFQS